MDIESAEAAFGASLPSQGLAGVLYVLPADNIDACAPLAFNVSTNDTLVALVRRGGLTPDGFPCLFDYKVVRFLVAAGRV